MGKEGRVEKIITRIILGIMVVFLLLILAVFIAIKSGATELFKMDRSIETKVYDIKAEDDAFAKIYKGYSNGIYAAKNYTEAYSNDLLLGRTALVENEVRYKNLIGWKLFAPTEYNSILYLDNGYLAGANKKESSETIGNIATKIKSLKDVSEEAGAKFFYLQTPGNIDKFGDEGINRVKDFANDNADALIADLKDYGIQCLDLRDNIEATFEDYHSLFFRTDHHWRQPVALWATNELCSYMEEQYGLEYDETLYDPDQYEMEFLEKNYLGSLGRKATLAATDPDDFEILHPKFATELHFTQDREDIDRTGPWEVLYDYDEINYDGIYWRECFLGLLSYYGTGRCTIENKNAERPETVLLVADSLCIPVTAFLSLNYEKVELLDGRYFEGSIKDYIRESKPDVVISSYTTTVIEEGYSIFDFK
ncbi:MAG: DHHW family protein [Lachnospiraceae bacterium]|nr:DHHW family protein [Lachnospiraceae bacterium]